MEDYPDFMIDLETMGTRPDRNHIIEIACIPFNHKTGAVSPRTFDRCLLPSEFRQGDAETMKWWLADPERKIILYRINSRLEPIREVLTDFAKFVVDTPHSTPPTFWGKTPGFDWFFLSGYAKDHAVHFPFVYWNQVEMKSYLCGLTGLEWDKVEKPTRQFAHSALHDCAFQIATVNTHTQRLTDQVDLHQTIADLRKSLHVLKQQSVPMPQRRQFDPLDDDDLPF